MDIREKNREDKNRKMNKINAEHLNAHYISQSYDNVEKIDENNYEKNNDNGGYESDFQYQDHEQRADNHENINEVRVNQSINTVDNKKDKVSRQIQNSKNKPKQNPQRNTNKPEEPVKYIANRNEINIRANPLSNNSNQNQFANQSPNRYFSGGNSMNTTSRSNKSISNNPVFISFGCIGQKANQPIHKQQNYVFNNSMVSNPPNINRQRIISQTSVRPGLIIPRNLPPPPQPPSISPPQVIKAQGSIISPVSTGRGVVFPNSHIIQRSPSIQCAYPIRIDTSRPMLTPKPQHFPNQFRTFVSFSNVESHPSIQQGQQNVPLAQQPPQGISSFPSTQFQSFHLLSPQNSSKIISIEHWYTQAITKYLQLSNKIHIIKQTTQGITQLINIMIKQQTSKQKQEFLRILKQKQNTLQQKLIQVQRQASQVIKENNQFQLQIQSNAKQQHHNEEHAHNAKNQLYSQLEKYKSKISQLTQTNAKYQQEIEKLHQSIKGSQQKTKKLEQLQLKQTQLSQQKISIEDELTKTIENQKIIIKKLEQELIQLHNEQNQKDQEINNEKTQIQKLEAVYEGKKKAQEEKLMTIIESKVAYINQLQAQIIRYKTQIKSLKQVIKEKQKNDRCFNEANAEQKINYSPLPIIGVKKTSSDLTQVAKLQKIIADKDDELDKVKQKIFEIQEQFDKVIDEKNEKIKELHEQIMELNKRQVQTTSLQSQNTYEIKSINIREMQQQLQNLKEMIIKKEQQLQELTQLTLKKSELKQQVQALTNETKKQRQNIQKQHQQKQKLEEILNNLQNNLQNKTKNQNKSQKQQDQIYMMLDTIKKKQIEIIKMREIIESHVKNIRELQNQIKDLTVKYKDIQYQLFDQKKSMDKQPHENHKIKDIQKQIQKNWKNCDVSKLKNMVKDLKKKIKQIEDGNCIEKQQKMVENGDNVQNHKKVSTQQQSKILQLQQIIKTKQSRIKQLQIKLTHQTNHEQDSINNHEIQHLKKKLHQYEILTNRNNPENLIKSYKIKNQHNTNVFEQQIIYQLKKENERLKNIIYGTANNHHKNGQSYVNNIQKRLNEFNVKLEELILENKQFECVGRTTRSNGSGENDVLERERLVIVKKYQKQIELLQSRIIELQRYCSSLEAFQMPAEFLPYIISQKQYSEETTIHSSQKTVYYREKNKELEERVDNLLKLNKELKDKYEQLSRNKNIEDNEFYIQQIKQLEEKIKQYEIKISDIIEKYNSNVKQYEEKENYLNKIRSLQSNINSLTNQISELEEQKKGANKNIKNNSNRIQTLEDELINIKISQMQKDEKVTSLENTIQANNNKISNYEQEIIKQTNNLQMFKKEIEKLQQELFNRKSNQQNINNQLKSKNNQLEREIAQLKRDVELSKQDKINSQRAYELDKKVSSLQYETKDLAEKNNDLKMIADLKSDEIGRLNELIKKLKEESAVPNEIKNQLEKLQQLTAKLHTEIQALHAQNAKLHAELASLSRKAEHSTTYKYEIEQIRSIFIEIETLIKELVIKDQWREKDIRIKLNKEIGLGLSICEEMNNLL